MVNNNIQPCQVHSHMLVYLIHKAKSFNVCVCACEERKRDKDAHKEGLERERERLMN